jgi:hypothetical protein
MRLFAIVAFTALMSAPALGDDVLFAAPPAGGVQPSIDTYQSGLSDIMGLTQLRHIKLWYAGRAHNWDLTNFEIGQIEETFGKAAMFYRNIPVEFIASIEKPLDTLRKAAAAKDAKLFAQGFADLSNACNSCHQAARVGFIVIQTPTSSPFADQRFDDIRK